MTLYAILDPQPGQPDLPAAIAERFSWSAALLPPVFLLGHGLWLETLAWFAGLVALGLMGRLFGGDAAWLLYGLSAAWLGLAAPGLRRHGLQWRGWRYRGPLIADSRDLAQLQAVENCP